MWHDAPTQAIERTYTRIQRERFAGTPLQHPGLRVQAVDVQRWQGHWLGALVTPWCLSLLLLPGPGGNWRMPAGNARLALHFPVGAIGFLGNDEAGLGPYLSAALLPDMRAFAAQHQAVRAARDALGALWDGAPAAAPQPATAARATAGAAAPTRRRLLGLR